MSRIQLMVPVLPEAEELLPYLKRIDAAHWYANFGPLVRELEQRFLKEVRGEGGAQPLVVSVSNCTVGLELALTALGLRAGAMVLVPGLTFVASAAAIRRAGCEPVVCDVDPDTWLLTPEIARRAAAETGIEAVMPVSTYGCPQDVEAWDEFSATTGIPVLLDAAGAFGNQKIGARVIHVFSLHATKVLSSAEGGIVVSHDARLLERVTRLSNFGIEPSGLVEQAGTNAKLSEYHAAVGLAMLDTWRHTAGYRVSLHQRYLAALSETCPEVRLQRRPADGYYSIMPVLLPAAASATVVGSALARRGIETRRWYCPVLNEHPAFADARTAGPTDVLRHLNTRILALPFHLKLQPDEVSDVCRNLAVVLSGRGG